jgi:hypothetical protein
MLDDWEQGWDGERWVGDPDGADHRRSPRGAVHAVSYTHWDDPGPYRTACGRWVALQFEEPFTDAEPEACGECVRAVRTGT